MTALGMILTGVGFVLAWAGIKNEDPRQMFVNVLQGRPATTAYEGAKGVGRVYDNLSPAEQEAKRNAGPNPADDYAHNKERGR